MFRTKSRKEKNKLASRACRLKKKAQHEANKIKLSGLEDEHSKCNIADACKAINWECWSLQILIKILLDELMRGLQQIKQIVHAKWSKSNGGQETANLSQEELTAEAEMILKRSQSMKHLIAPVKIFIKHLSFQNSKLRVKQQIMSTRWLQSTAVKFLSGRHETSDLCIQL